MSKLIVKNWEDNLCTVIDIDKDAIERSVIYKMIYSYFLKSGKIYVSVFRPNYPIQNIDERLTDLSSCVHSLRTGKDLRSIFFCYDGLKNPKIIIDLCLDLWYAFENVDFYFIPDVVEDLHLFDPYKSSWKDLLRSYPGYIMFHYGMGDDIVWIGKSETMEFLVTSIH